MPLKLNVPPSRPANAVGAAILQSANSVTVLGAALWSQMFEHFSPDDSIADYVIDHQLVQRIGQDVLPFAWIHGQDRYVASGLELFRSLDTTRLRADLCDALRREPLLDGYKHPADAVITQAYFLDERILRSWFGKLLDEPDQTDFAADVLRLLCRVPLYSPEWQLSVVRKSLASSSAALREAGIQAVECWRSQRELLNALRSHREETPWLAEYARQVIEDLGG
jgi:hypothetical protein